MADELPSDQGSVLSVVLFAIFLNVYFCGIIGQQQYSYWTSDFEDPIYVRALTLVQFFVVLFQSFILWPLAWGIYVDHHDILVDSKGGWQIPVNAVCQCVLILMANVFLAVRIYTLTNCPINSGIVFGLSFSTFIAGLVTIAIDWPLRSKGFDVSGRAISVVWRALQAVTECLIMYLLSRALLASRSGIQKPDHIVKHFIRNIIQLGLFATLWAIAGMATWFLFPRSWVCTVFDVTSGSIYTHMIYDGLLSRTRSRECMVERSLFAVGFPSQSLSHTFEGNRSSRLPRPHVSISQVTRTVTDFRTTTRDATGPSGIGEDNDSDIGGKLGVGYDFTYNAGE